MNHNLIASTAIVASTAQLGKEVQIDDFAIVEEGVVIGDYTHIHSHAVIRKGARIGSHCEIHPGAVIAGVPQDLKFKGEESLAIIGDYTTVREYATVNRGTASKGITQVGSHCLIMAYSHIAHDCILKDYVIIGNASQIAGEVEIDDYAILSANVLVHQFVRISKHVMIQGGSRVSKDIPPYTLIGRDPIVYCGINIVGLRRRGFTNEQIYQINDVYRTVYQRGLNNSQAIEVILQESDSSEERDFIIKFIQESNRGIVRGSID